MNKLVACSSWQPANHVIYHLANSMLCLGLMIPDSNYGALILHGFLFLGFLLLCIWSWVILCAPDFFFWNFACLLLNGLQAFSLMYNIRSVKFCDELEEVYVSLFKPLRVPRQLYRKLMCPEHCFIVTLHEGETYATQSVTRTDKLGLLISGTMHAYSNRSLLHTITEKQFIDSPEFESTATGDDKFQVSIVASSTCRYLFWPRQSLEYMLVKEPYLAAIMKIIIGRDLTNKLYALNERVASPGTTRLDIRLPGITHGLRNRRDSPRHGKVNGSGVKDLGRLEMKDEVDEVEKHYEADETDVFLPILNTK